MNEEELVKILKEIGFNEKEIKEFCLNSNLDKQCKCLNKKRKELLEDIHLNENYISNLDYLKYILEREVK